MEQVIRAYGKFILDGTVVVLLMVLVMTQIRDDAGHKGVFEMIGSYLENEIESDREYTDFSVYAGECKKKFPEMCYFPEVVLHTGQHQISQLIRAVDYTGRELPVRLISVRIPDGKEIELAGQERVEFQEPGIYEIKASSMEAWNRRTECVFRIPVNREEGAY